MIKAETFAMDSVQFTGGEASVCSIKPRGEIKPGIIKNGQFQEYTPQMAIAMFDHYKSVFPDEMAKKSSKRALEH
jgi:hypothetical protein